MKLCKICNQEKSINLFYKKKSGLDGLQSRCKECIASYLEQRNYKPIYDGKLIECSTCNILKEKSLFYPDKRQKEGLRPECKKCNRDTVLKRKFGITIDLYESMLSTQNNGCAICETRVPSGTGNFHVDHNHKTGKVRGLLCSNCNTAIGLLKEEESIILKVIKYLKEHND